MKQLEDILFVMTFWGEFELHLLISTGSFRNMGFIYPLVMILFGILSFRLQLVMTLFGMLCFLEHLVMTLFGILSFLEHLVVTLFGILSFLFKWYE